MFLQQICIRGDRLTHVLSQTERERLLTDLATLREAPPADLEGLGRWALSIPFEDHAALVRKYPELGAPDAKVRARAWLKYINSAESRPYRMRDRI